MSIPDNAWNTIHPAVYSEAGSLLRWAQATPRPHGALRYQCPVTGSFVLLTDEAVLAGLARPRGRTRCPGCGEMHLLTRDHEAGDAAFVAEPATS